MSLESSLKKLCTPAVLSRARRLAATGDALHVRRCRYEGEETVIDARVDSSASWDGPHRPQVVIDEEQGDITYFECDCASSRGTNKPCKHSAALVLDFCTRPDSYEGYDVAGRVRTSRAIVSLIERTMRADVPAAGTTTEPRGHTVDIELGLVYEAGFSARFRLVGSQGSYVMRSISEFVSNVERRTFASYGRRLSFVHDEGAFTERGWQVAECLLRAVRNRRAYAFDRAVGEGPLGTNGAPQRDMHLSSVELWDLLAIYAGESIVLEDHATPSEGESPAKKLRVIDGDPELGFSLTDFADGAYEITREGGARYVTSGGRALAWDDDCLYCCSERFSQCVSMLGDVLTSGPEKFVVAQRDVPAFVAWGLPLLERAGRTEVPSELEVLRPAPLELEFYLDRNDRGVMCEPYAVYGGSKLSLMGGSATEEGERKDETHVPVRDAKAEAQGRTAVRRYFTMAEDGALLVPANDADAVAAFVFEGVGELQRLGTVYATDAYDRLKSKVRPKPKLELSVRSNLLDLRVSADGLSARELAELLESYRLRKRYHRLRDGSFLDLGEVDCSEVACLVEELGITERQLVSGTQTMPAYRALLLDQELAASRGDRSVGEYLASLGELGQGSKDVPASLAGTLRPYQRDGFAWMCALQEKGLAGILADEMGLGKSLQLITLLLAWHAEARIVGPSLVVCPASLVYNWSQEFSRFAPELDVLVVAGSVDERAELRGRPADVFVTSYDLLRRDVGDYASMRLWLVALDEAQYIKNQGTLAARAVKELRAEHRFALTGTPVENRLAELWSIFDFLMPGLLGTYDVFCERFERPIAEEGNDAVAERLARAISPFILRRTKRDVLQDLPDKLEQVVYARMGNEQQSLYDAQVQELRAQLSESPGEVSGPERMQVLAALMRLRQTCCDPSLVFEDYEGPSCKVDTILTLVERACDAGERVLLFSQFTSFLRILADKLSELGVGYLTLTGSTPKKRRMELVEEFNAGAAEVFLISLKAGGTGLNLTGASVVIHADPWWNAAAQDQATDRAHRMGQTRDVTVYKVICADTLEERIQDLQRRKAMLASQVVGARTDTVSLADIADLLA